MRKFEHLWIKVFIHVLRIGAESDLCVKRNFVKREKKIRFKAMNILMSSRIENLSYS